MGEAAIDILYDGMAAADRIVAKAAGLSEVAQMARAEARLRQYVEAKWNARKKQAVREASALARKLKPARQIARAVGRAMGKWADDVEETYLKEFEGIYRLARRAAWAKALKHTTASLGFSTPKSEMVYKRKPWPKLEAVPTFDLVDEAAVEALRSHQLFWIGEHYKGNVSPLIAATASETMVEAGMSRAAASRLMQERVGTALSMVKTPSGWNGTQREYFAGLVGNASTVARAHGQLRSFVDLGVTKYEIMNPVDRRTCQICSHLNGKVYSVQHGTRIASAELAAESPDEVKRAHPWIPDTKAGLERLQELSPTKGRGPAKESASLAEAGFALPPFHFRCRCTVDVSTEAGSWQPFKEPTSISPTAFVAPPTPAFMPATTLAKAQAFARARVAKSATFGSVPLEMANMVNEELLMLQAEFGLGKLESLALVDGWEGANAASSAAGGRIVVGSKRVHDVAKIRSEASRIRFIAGEEEIAGNSARARLLKEKAKALEKVADAIDAGVEGVHAGVHSMHAYKNTLREQTRAVTRHEFGHVLHQQKRPARTAEILGVEDDVRTTRGIARYAVTERAGNNLTEAFAENLALYKKGLRSEIDPKMLQVFEELKAGGRM